MCILYFIIHLPIASEEAKTPIIKTIIKYHLIIISYFVSLKYVIIMTIKKKNIDPTIADIDDMLLTIKSFIRIL